MKLLKVSVLSSYTILCNLYDIIFLYCPLGFLIIFLWWHWKKGYELQLNETNEQTKTTWIRSRIGSVSGLEFDKSQ